MKKIFLSIVMAVSAILGASAQTTAANPVTVENPNLKVTLSDITLVPGGDAAYLTVSEECEGGTYAAFQMVMHFPKGIEVNKVKSGRKEVDDVALNAVRFDGLTHSISLGTPEVEDGFLLKVACIDLTSNDNFYNDDINGKKVTELLKVGLKANSTAAFGDFKVLVDQIKFIKKNSDADVPSGEVSFTVSIPDPAGIENVSLDNTPAEFYTIDGKKLQEPQKGINIIRMSDGSVLKQVK